MNKTLIGKTVSIVESSNKSLVGIEGRVVDETKNTIKIMDKKNQEKTLIKSQVIKLKVDNIVVDAKKITKRIEERIKK
jgi:ribonuclease P protein subunit POP4